MFERGKVFGAVFLSLFTFCIGQADTAAQSASAIKPALSIVINIPGRTLSLYDNNKLLKSYPVGVGRADSQTPLGQFKIKLKEKNPVWINPNDLDMKIDSGPENPLGYRWMEIDSLYGIHGTNQPDSVGGYVSNGCIRMYENDVEELFDKVDLETPVTITYERLQFEQTQDGSLYIQVYGDEYWKQPLGIAEVRKKLEMYHVNSLLSDEQLHTLLLQSDGQRHRLLRVYPVYVMGKRLELFGIVGEDGMYYIPLIEAAQAANVAVGWDYNTKMLSGVHGSVKARLYNNVIYINSDHVYTILGVYVNWRGEHESMLLDSFQY